MRFTKITVALTAIGPAVAQRPANVSICDYYTTALFQNNTANNQATLLTALVNTVVIGNYTQPNVGVVVPGIIAKGTFNGTAVNLLPFFDGTLNSTNRGGSSGVSVNFLDGGGAEPLTMNKPANDEQSNQYFLLTHLYQFFGSLLGCSMQGMPGFAAYAGDPSMFQVHKFMALDPNQLGYFIQQVALAGASFGVAQEDLEAVGMALNRVFGLRCAPPVEVIESQGAQLQAICVAENCPLSPDAVCNKYEAPMEASSSTATMGPTSMGAAPTSTMSTAGADRVGLGIAAAAVGFAALLL